MTWSFPPRRPRRYRGAARQRQRCRPQALPGRGTPSSSPSRWTQVGTGLRQPSTRLTPPTREIATCDTEVSPRSQRNRLRGLACASVTVAAHRSLLGVTAAPLARLSARQPSSSTQGVWTWVSTGFDEYTTHIGQSHGGWGWAVPFLLLSPRSPACRTGCSSSASRLREGARYPR